MKILFTDLDNTLLQTDKGASAKNVDALHRALDSGAFICLNTGRALAGAKYFLERLGLVGREHCYILSANGALIYDVAADNNLKVFPFPKETVANIFALSREMGIYCQAFEERDLLIPGDTEESHHYITSGHMPYRILPHMPDDITADLIKLLLINLHDHKKLEDFRAEYPRRFPDDPVALFFSSEYYLEIGAAGINKGSGIRWLCDYLGIPVEESVGVGDEENDIPMLEAAGLGVAVANAQDEVKAAADLVLPLTNDEDAVAYLLNTYFL